MLQNRTFRLVYFPDIWYDIEETAERLYAMNKEERKTIQQQYMDKMVNHLPTLRSAAKLTQNQFGEKLGIARSTVVVLESKGRPLQWNMYLAMVLIFLQNEDSKKLLESFEIYDEKYLQEIT